MGSSLRALIKSSITEIRCFWPAPKGRKWSRGDSGGRLGKWGDNFLKCLTWKKRKKCLLGRLYLVDKMKKMRTPHLHTSHWAQPVRWLPKCEKLDQSKMGRKNDYLRWVCGCFLNFNQILIVLVTTKLDEILLIAKDSWEEIAEYKVPWGGAGQNCSNRESY